MREHLDFLSGKKVQGPDDGGYRDLEEDSGTWARQGNRTGTACAAESKTYRPRLYGRRDEESGIHR